MKYFPVFLLLAVGSCTESHIIKNEVEYDSFTPEANDVRIQGGETASIKEFPYMISVQNNKGALGAGVIINKYWGLTAGVIFYSYCPGSLAFLTGSSQQNRGKVLKVEKYFNHPKYKGGWKDDLTIFKFTKPVKVTNSVKPISIASSLPENGTMVTVSGWGGQNWMKTTGTMQLKSVEVEYTESKTCQPLYPEEIDDGNFCSFTPDKSPCAYDWGAPVVYQKTLIGIFVGGEVCRSPLKPSLYLDLTKYREWILDTIQKNSNSNEINEINQQLLDEDE